MSSCATSLSAHYHVCEREDRQRPHPVVPHGASPAGTHTALRPTRAWGYPDQVHARHVHTVFLSLLGLAVVAVGLAEAHAKLARSEPAASSTLRAAPAEVRLWFTENLEPAFSGAHLLDGEQRRVDGIEGRVDAVNAALLRMALPPLGAGRYTVVYRVVSVDSHVTAGELTFQIVR
jgi:copper resistance protein C